MEKISKESLDKMMFMLLRLDEDKMLETADSLLTTEEELTYVGAELYELGYAS